MKLFYVLISVFLLAICSVGCNSVQPKAAIECRHEAVAVALAANEVNSARLAVGLWKGEAHVQAQVKIKETWRFVKRAPAGNKLVVIRMKDFEVIDYIEIQDYIQILLESN